MRDISYKLQAPNFLPYNIQTIIIVNKTLYLIRCCIIHSNPQMSVTKGQPPRKTKLFGNFQRIPRNVWVLGFVSLLTDISSETVNSLLPLFLVSTFQSGVLTIGIIEGIAEATAAIFKLFSGVLSDYFRRRKSLAILW